VTITLVVPAGPRTVSSSVAATSPSGNLSLSGSGGDVSIAIENFTKMTGDSRIDVTGPNTVRIYVKGINETGSGHDIKLQKAPGDSLKEGKAVNLWYSTGLGDEKVEVPNVVGYSVKYARDFLLRHELRSVVVDTNLRREGASSQDVDIDSLERTIYVRKQGHIPESSVRAGTKIRLFTTVDRSEALERREALEDSTDSSN